MPGGRQAEQILWQAWWQGSLDLPGQWWWMFLVKSHYAWRAPDSIMGFPSELSHGMTGAIV